MALLVPHGTQAYREVAGCAISAKKRYLQIVDRNPLKSSVNCLRHSPAPSQGHHIHKWMTQKIGLAVSRFKTAPVGITHQAGCIEDHNHALGVVENVPIEVTFTAVTALRLAPIRDVF